MKNKHFLHLCMAMGLIIANSGHAVAADPGVYYYFEDNNDPAMPSNSGDAPFSMHYLGDAQQTTTQHRFGKGSMLIGEKKGVSPFSGPSTGLASMLSEFSDSIQKMTITLWVRPAAQPEGATNSFNPSFNILSRFSSGETGSNGAGYFIYNFTYKRFNFWYSSGGEKKIQTFSSPPVKISMESDEWVHMAITFDEGKVVFYYNGFPIGDADGRPDGATSIPATQGKSILLAFFTALPGDCIDDFGFFVSRSLTESEIESVYNNGLEEFLKKTAAKK